MIFGKSDSFAIEIGELQSYPESSGLYVQFRFLVGNVPVGDWDDRIPLIASVEYARSSCEMGQFRLHSPFAERLPHKVFEAVYDNYYCLEYDSTSELWTAPDYRDRFHLDSIGMGAIQDKYGLVLVASSDGLERVIAKDLRQDLLIADVSIPLGFVESVLSEYVEWGRTELLAARR